MGGLSKVLVIGSGPIIIGQAAEFDYAGAQACKSLREEGITTVLVNSNPATIMTDEGIADIVYIDPLTVEVDTAQPCLGRKGNELGVVLLNLPAAEIELLFRQDHDAAALRRLVRQRGELGGDRERLCADTRRRAQIARLPVAERDGAGLVQQQRIDVARRFYRSP